VSADPADRRREARAPSARSLLLTVLGEFVLPRHEPVWTGALVAGLAELGVEEKSARQALARTAAEQLLEAERSGRRTRWALTDAGERLLEQGAARIYSFGRGAGAWDGRWLTLSVSVPESQRQLRHRLRTRLTWVGMGSPLPGLWVTPDAAKEPEVAAVVRELGVEAFSFVGPFGRIGEEKAVVEQAWALDDVERRYRDFLVSVQQQSARTPRDVFRAQVQLVQDWRRFPFLDPDLPRPLLPSTWPGAAAAQLFERRHAQWHSRAQAWWAELAASAATRA
jgi:phenylacetic acid degradation operon negative regulatory protein